jgi:hypothetical protein
MSLKKLGKSGMFGLAGLAATNPKITNKVARNGGLGIMGMLAAKNKKAAQGGMRDAGMGAPIMSGDVDAMMGRSAQRDMSGMKKGGKVKKMAKGGSTASKRADGCATKGKTKGRFV